MTKENSICESYVPRHVRCGKPNMECTAVATAEVVEQVPVLDSNNDVVAIQTLVKVVPSFELMKDVKAEDFKISNLQKAGVPLTEVTFNLNSRAQYEALVSKALQFGVVSQEFVDSMPVQNNEPISNSSQNEPLNN